MLSASQFYYMDAKVGHHIVTTSKPWSLFTICNAFVNFAGSTKSFAHKFGAERAVNLWN